MARRSVQVEEARAEARAEELKLQSLLEEAEAIPVATAEELKLQSLLEEALERRRLELRLERKS